MKKFPADEEAVKQLLQELKKKIAENLRLKEVMEDFYKVLKKALGQEA